MFAVIEKTDAKRWSQ